MYVAPALIRTISLAVVPRLLFMEILLFQLFAFCVHVEYSSYSYKTFGIFKMTKTWPVFGGKQQTPHLDLLSLQMLPSTCTSDWDE